MQRPCNSSIPLSSWNPSHKCYFPFWLLCKHGLLLWQLIHQVFFSLNGIFEHTFWAWNTFATLAAFFIIWERLVLKKNKIMGAYRLDFFFYCKFLILKLSIKFLLKQSFSRKCQITGSKISSSDVIFVRYKAGFRGALHGLLIGCHRPWRGSIPKVLEVLGTLSSHRSPYSQSLFLQGWDFRTVHSEPGYKNIHLRWYEWGFAWEMLIHRKTENDVFEECSFCFCFLMYF